MDIIGDRYLAYCNGTQFGDYEHGALWFDLEPSVKKFASDADVIFLGDSHIQFGFRRMRQINGSPRRLPAITCWVSYTVKMCFW